MARDVVDDRLIGALHLLALTRAGLHHDPAVEHTAFQAGTLDALMAGRFDGDATLGDLLEHGDLGIGTIQHLDGELAVLDGDAWVIAADGRVRPVPPETRTPFAVVCHFTPTARASVSEPLDLRALHRTLDDLAPANAPLLAVRVDGRFADLRLRSVHAQDPPYPPLSDVVEHQTEWAVPAATGTLLGFRFPDATAGVEVPGYHLHFLSDDRRVGGHVLDLTRVEGEVALDPGAELHIELPAHVGLGVPGAADRAEIARLEGGG
ncbi:MAG: acetolactate decarboxylase [Acidimicrobiia bacterium]